MRHVTAFVAALAILPAAAARADDYYDDGYEYVPQDPGSDQQAYDPAAYPQYDPSQYSIGYVGYHPVPYQYGSGFCYIEGAHSHEYMPFDSHLFREHNGYYYFVGDPVDFGYDRTIYWFNGNHPVPTSYGNGWCYISWPHRHAYQPTGIGGFTFVGGYWLFGGPWPSDYYLYRDYYWGYYGGYYRNWYYGNRYYNVRPPAAYAVSRPVRIAAPPGRVFVAAPPPAIRSGASLPGPVGRPVPAMRPYGASPVVPAGRPYGAPPVGPAGAYRPPLTPVPAMRPGVGSPPVYGRPPAYTPAPRPAYGPTPVPRPAYGAPPAYSRPTYTPPSYARPAYTPPSVSRPTYTPRFSPPASSGFRSPAAAPSYHPSRAYHPAPVFRAAPAAPAARSGGFGGGFRRR